MLPGQFFDQNKASEVVFMELICMFVESKNHKSEIQNPLRILPLSESGKINGQKGESGRSLERTRSLESGR